MESCRLQRNNAQFCNLRENAACLRLIAGISSWHASCLSLKQRKAVKMNTLLILILLLILLGGGGFYWGGPVYGGSGIGLILLIIIIVALTGGFRRR